MNVGIIGTGSKATARRQAVEALDAVRLAGVLDVAPALFGDVPPADIEAFVAGVDAVFVAAPTADHFHIAEAATKQGVHAFLEWPPATSVRECQAIVQLAEEAGVEVGVSRPLRFLPVFEQLPEAWRASLILLRRAVNAAEPVWPHWLADAVDLCCALAQSPSVQRVDAEAVRRDGPWPDVVAFGLRFHSGTYAQVSIRRSDAPPSRRLYVGGSGFDVDDVLVLPEENDGSDAAYETAPSLLIAETQAFVQAVAGQQPVPVSILDGLHTLRLVERLMQKLR